ncbi:MAG: hypothetical protein FWD47_05670 [Treponema sp.]|nr:hypothetical protein [Treponema sp.]
MKPVFMLIIFNIVFLNVFAQLDSNAVFEEAIEKIENEEFLSAIELLKQLEDSNDYSVFFHIGICYYFLDNDEYAQRYLKRSIELNDSHIESHGYLGMSYFFSEKFTEAETMFLRCIELGSTSYRNYFFLGKIYEYRNNLDIAINYYKEALKLNELDFQTNYSLAFIYFFRNDFNNAKKYFEICDALDSQLFWVVNFLIRIKYAQNDLDNVEGLKQRLRAIKQTENDPRITRLTRFVIDEFSHKEYRIIAEESFELSGMLYYHWTFLIYGSNGRLVKTVNLESSAGLRELGTNYIIGTDEYADNRRIHRTTTIGFRQLPEYNVMKGFVIEELDNGLEVGAMGIYPVN